VADCLEDLGPGYLSLAHLVRCGGYRLDFAVRQFAAALGPRSQAAVVAAEWLSDAICDTLSPSDDAQLPTSGNSGPVESWDFIRRE